MSPLYNRTILWMYRQTQRLGLSIRIFDKLLSGEFAVSTGRDAIRETLLDAIARNPFLGYGLCSDRVLAGHYAHSLALELWVEFGVIFGTAILIALTVALWRGYRKADGEIKPLILLLTFSSFFKLFLSGSYLNERFLLLLLGLCVCSIRLAKQKQSAKTGELLCQQLKSAQSR